MKRIRGSEPLWGLLGFRQRHPSLALTCTAMLRLTLSIAVLWLLATLTAHAENLGPTGGARVIAGDEIHGPFRLFITSSPAPAQVGSVTFAVRVTDAQSGATVKDADVRVTLARPDSDAQWEAIATHQDAGSPVDYAAHITIDRAGQYNGVIRVRAAAGQAEIAFVQPVLAPRSTTTLLIVALPFVAAFGILAALWLLRFRGRQAA